MTAPVVADGVATDVVAEHVPAPTRALRASKPSKARPPVGRTTRVVLRHLDPWTVLKLSLVYYLCLFVVLLVAGVLLWAGANAAGVVGNLETFMEDIGFEDFRFIPSQLLSGVAVSGLVLVFAGTCANVLMTVLFNLMADVVGGLKLTLQEDVSDVAQAPSGEGRTSV